MGPRRPRTRRPQLARGGHQIVRDMWGEEWQPFERHKTPYGFDLLFGRPYPPPPVQGGSGGTGVIMTPPLAKALRTHARRPSEARVWQMRVALLGRQRRPAGWWRTPEVLALLRGNLAQDVVAKRLHITPVRVGELRRKLRLETRVRHSRGTAARRKRPGTHGRTPRGR